MKAVDTGEMLAKAHGFFEREIAARHVRNVKKLSKLDEFNVNPYTVYYLAAFAFGDTSSTSLAKALIYPRALGTSIATTFGAHIQTFCHTVLGGFPSVVPGMDIEFDDQVDGRHKYCQIKAGPQTINHDDVTTIANHFRSLRNLARTNGLPLNDATDCCVGVLYGTPDDLNTHYRLLAEDYPVLVGEDFWLRLTGDRAFYGKLSMAFAACAKDYVATNALDKTVELLARDIERHPGMLPSVPSAGC